MRKKKWEINFCIIIFDPFVIINVLLQYKQKNSPVSIKQTEEEDEDDENVEEEEEEEEENMDEDEDDADLDATELTMIDCTLIDSDSSLNNNLNCSTSSPCKIITAVVPILEPNG